MIQKKAKDNVIEQPPTTAPINKQNQHSKESNEGQKPVIQSKAGQQPVIQSKAGQQSPYQSNEGSKPPIQAKQSPVESKPNNTGLPDQLKSGVEKLSGHSMDDVKVHYNSSKPAQLKAHAYAQGTDIHLASGQEHHLPHEAWHVVQQKQGRVKPTTQLKGKNVAMNDDQGLEKEADVMGDKALTGDTSSSTVQLKTSSGQLDEVVQRVALAKDKLNVIGEDHNESDTLVPPRRTIERQFSQQVTKGGYWEEQGFKVDVGHTQEEADPHSLRFLRNLHKICDLAKDFKGDYDSDKASSIVNKARFVHISTSALIGVAENNWTNTEGVAYPGNLNPQQLQTRDGLMRGRYNQLQTFKASMTALKDLHGQRLTPQKKEVVGQHFDRIVTARKEMVKNLMTVQTIDKLRSEKMHEAAQAKYNVKGVWKIGDDHITDIKQNLPDIEAPKYHVLTRAEFNEILNNPSQEDLQILQDIAQRLGF